MNSDVLLLSYVDEMGLILTGEPGQALAYLYSEARLYTVREPERRLFLSRPHHVLQASEATSPCVKKVGHSNTRGAVRALFFPAQIYCCTTV